jgi:hypothetical protein
MSFSIHYPRESELQRTARNIATENDGWDDMMGFLAYSFWRASDKKAFGDYNYFFTLHYPCVLEDSVIVVVVVKVSSTHITLVGDCIHSFPVDSIIHKKLLVYTKVYFLPRTPRS